MSKSIKNRMQRIMEAKVIGHHSILHKLLEDRGILQVPRVIFIYCNDVKNFCSAKGLTERLLALTCVCAIKFVLQSDI